MNWLGTTQTMNMTILALVSLSYQSPDASARGGAISHVDLASTRPIEKLPPEVRRSVERWKSVCGFPLTARRSFVHYLGDRSLGHRFMAKDLIFGPASRAGAREVSCADSEVVFGALTQNWSSLGPFLGFAAIAGAPCIENGGAFAVDLADRRRDRHNIDVRPDAPFGVPHRLFRGLYGIARDSQCGVPGNGGNSKRRLNLKTTSVLG
jgi:hypothetical protein